MGIWYISLFIFLLELDGRILYIFSLFITNPEKILPYLFFYLLLFLGIFTGVPECCISASGGSLLNIPGLKNWLSNI